MTQAALSQYIFLLFTSRFQQAWSYLLQSQWGTPGSVFTLLFNMTTCVYWMLFSEFQTLAGAQYLQYPVTEDLKHFRVEILRQKGPDCFVDIVIVGRRTCLSHTEGVAYSATPSTGAAS